MHVCVCPCVHHHTVFLEQKQEQSPSVLPHVFSTCRTKSQALRPPPPGDSFPVLCPQDIRRTCLEARRLHENKETLDRSSGAQSLSSPIRLRCVLGEDNEAVEIQQCECDDNRELEPNHGSRSLPDCCSPSPVSSCSLTVPSHSCWLGSIGAGVRARCGGLCIPGCSQGRLGGWGEARRQRTWGPANEEGQATLRVEVYVVVNCFGDVIPNVRGGEDQSSVKERELAHSTPVLLRESGRLECLEE